VFSLKEAIYKAVFSATAIELDYANASIAWTPNGPVVTFVGDVTRAPELAALTLATRVAIGPEWVLAAATLRRTS
jgi:4'-phosphopantetheinyl transferase EntD